MFFFVFPGRRFYWLCGWHNVLQKRWEAPLKRVITIVVAAIAAVGVVYYLLLVLRVLGNFANG